MKHKTIATLIAATMLGVAGSASAFELSSPDIKPNSTTTNKHVLMGFGCEGENVSPALAWKNAPKGATASLVGYMVNANSIGRARLTGMYARKK